MQFWNIDTSIFKDKSATNAFCCTYTFVAAVNPLILPSTDLRREYLMLCSLKSEAQYNSIKSKAPNDATQIKTNMKMINQCDINHFIPLCNQELNPIPCTRGGYWLFEKFVPLRMQASQSLSNIFCIHALISCLNPMYTNFNEANRNRMVLFLRRALLWIVIVRKKKMQTFVFPVLPLDCKRHSVRGWHSLESVRCGKRRKEHGYGRHFPSLWRAGVGK